MCADGKLIEQPGLYESGYQKIVHGEGHSRGADKNGPFRADNSRASTSQACGLGWQKRPFRPKSTRILFGPVIIKGCKEVKARGKKTTVCGLIHICSDFFYSSQFELPLSLEVSP